MTIAILGKVYEGEIIDNNFFVDGKKLLGIYKQGRTGTKRYTLPVYLSQTKKGLWYCPSYFVNNSGQIKDPNMYLLAII